MGEQQRDHLTSFNAKVSVHGFRYLGVLGGMLEYLGECLCTLEVFEDTWGCVVVLWGYLGYLGDA